MPPKPLIGSFKYPTITVRENLKNFSLWHPCHPWHLIYIIMDRIFSRLPVPGDYYCYQNQSNVLPYNQVKHFTNIFLLFRPLLLSKRLLSIIANEKINLSGFDQNLYVIRLQFKDHVISNRILHF